MILNLERGKIFFGGSEDLYHNELLNFVNFTAPRLLEKSVAVHVTQGPPLQAAEPLRELLGSSK